MDILIKKPTLVTKDARARLSADIVYEGTTYPLWFEVDEANGKWLADDRSDAFVLAVLHLAFIKHCNIVCEAPVTERLYRNLTEQFIPVISLFNKWTTKLVADTVPEFDSPEKNGVGTGCSCGVDSLHAFAAHPEITHACVWNVHGVVAHDSMEKREKGWKDLVDRATAFAHATGKTLIIADTNFDRGSVPGLRWDGMTTNGNLFCVFALQKLFKRYYVASNGFADGFSMRLTDYEGQTPAYYEFFLFSFVSLAHLEMILDGACLNRISKIRDLEHYEPAYRFLNVCHNIVPGEKNCSYLCSKCMTTMLAMDALGILDRFADLFDVGYYRTHMGEYYGEYLRGLLQHNPFCQEIKPFIDNVTFTMLDRLIGTKIVFKKMIKKFFRFGRIKWGEFSPKG